MSKRAPPGKPSAPGDAGREGTPTDKIAVRFARDDHPPGDRWLQALRELRRQQRLQVRRSAFRSEEPAQAPARAAQEDPTVPALEATPPTRTPKLRAARSPAAVWDDLSRERARAPLDPSRYRALAALAQTRGDGDRAALMQEIARALEGGAFTDAPSPSRMLRQEDWQALLRSGVRSAAFDLFAIAGPALCAAEARPAEELGVGRPFTMDRNEGSRATGEALLAAVRVLGLRAPDVSMGSAQTPPLRPVNTQPPRIVVGGQAAAAKPLPSALLRFFAGRALACFHPELTAPRLLGSQQLEARMRQLALAVADQGPVPQAALSLARRVSAKGHRRLDELFKMLALDGVSAASLRRSARYCVNRAGLVVAGSAAAAVAALRAKRGGAAELEDLLAFAASERYYQIRFGRPPAFAP